MNYYKILKFNKKNNIQFKYHIFQYCLLSLNLYDGLDLQMHFHVRFPFSCILFFLETKESEDNLYGILWLLYPCQKCTNGQAVSQ